MDIIRFYHRLDF